MASVCSGSLALMAGGVPLSAVSGIAMGLLMDDAGIILFHLIFRAWKTIMGIWILKVQERVMELLHCSLILN